jgi:hypothetical protein
MSSFTYALHKTINAMQSASNASCVIALCVQVQYSLFRTRRGPLVQHPVILIACE